MKKAKSNKSRGLFSKLKRLRLKQQIFKNSDSLWAALKCLSTLWNYFLQIKHSEYISHEDTTLCYWLDWQQNPTIIVQTENKLLSLRVSQLTSIKAVSKIKQIEYPIYWLHHLNWFCIISNWFCISFQLEENGLEHLPKY